MRERKQAALDNGNTAGFRMIRRGKGRFYGAGDCWFRACRAALRLPFRAAPPCAALRDSLGLLAKGLLDSTAEAKQFTGARRRGKEHWSTAEAKQFMAVHGHELQNLPRAGPRQFLTVEDGVYVVRPPPRYRGAVHSCSVNARTGCFAPRTPERGPWQRTPLVQQLITTWALCPRMLRARASAASQRASPVNTVLRLCTGPFAPAVLHCRCERPTRVLSRGGLPGGWRPARPGGRRRRQPLRGERARQRPRR